MKRICPHCGYEWQYKGQMTVNASCPNCRRAVKLEGEKEKPHA